jgi:protein-disulfide isomerase
VASAGRFGPLAAEARRAVHRRPPQGVSRRAWFLTLLVAALIGALVAVVIAIGHQSTARARVGGEVRSLLAGIPEHGETLGQGSAPSTLVFYGDLECATTKRWVLAYLPAIIRRYVRPGTMKIEFRAFKTDTHDQREFVEQQTAALAAGAQDRLWPFIETFYYEQGREYTPYVTESFLDGIASQVKGLNLVRWRSDREGGRRSEQIALEDSGGRAAGFHDTPSFLIGPSKGPLKDFVGRTVTAFFLGRKVAPSRYEGHLERPVSLIDTQDIAAALQQPRAEVAPHNSQSAAGHG